MAGEEFYYPLVNYNFLLRVDGNKDIQCRSVKGFQQEIEYEYIQEGGLNEYVHMRKKPASKPFTFQVERYVGENKEDVLPVGARFSQPMVLIISPYQNDFKKPKRKYVFTGCRVISKDYGELNGEQSGFLTETTTIAYEEMKCEDDSTYQRREPWKFNGKNVNGNGKKSARQAADYGIKENNHLGKKRKWPETESAKKYHGSVRKAAQ